jgi:hypothetical protein
VRNHPAALAEVFGNSYLQTGRCYPRPLLYGWRGKNEPVQSSFRDSPSTGVLSVRSKRPMTPNPTKGRPSRSRPNCSLRSSLLPTIDNSSTTTPTILQKFDKDINIGCKYIPTFHSACPRLPIGKPHKQPSGTPPPLGPNEAIGPTKRTSPPRKQKNSRSEPSCFFKYHEISIHTC